MSSALGHGEGRRGQFEIMGLAIIVVIIAFAILLSLRFIKPSQTTDLKKDVTDSTLASNTLTVILKTTLDCKDIDLKSLLQDCAEGVTNKEYCTPDDNDPCGKVKDIINKSILQKTLDVWKKDYTFSATVVGASQPIFPPITNTPILASGPTCGITQLGKRYTSVISELFPVSLKNGRLMEISLSICR
jgi:hypothetical protein